MERALTRPDLFMWNFKACGEINVKNKRDRLFFTQLFVPQASQSSYDRRTELEVLFAIPSAQSACEMENRMKTDKEKTKWIWKRYRNVFL